MDTEGTGRTENADGTQGTYADGTPCWVAAMLPDLASGVRFYGELFGWRAPTPATSGEASVLATLDGEPVATLVAKPDGRMPTEWALHLAVADADAAADRARAAGGTVVMEPFALGDTGTTAVIADPGGAVFQLWQPGELAGFPRTKTPGTYAWAELYTRDPAAVDRFYTDMFGFSATDLAGATTEAGLGHEGGGPEDFVIWTPRGEPVDLAHAVLGRCRIDERYPDRMPPHFLTYFAVADCDATVRTAVRLGGRASFGPVDSPYGRYAFLVDNQGAHFAVMRPADAPGDASPPPSGPGETPFGGAP